MTENRIYFKNNPYPNGHRIAEFKWQGSLDEEGLLWFTFHLKTDPYYAEDPHHGKAADTDPVEGLEDWQAKNVWSNYGECTLSTQWGSSGIAVDVTAGKLNFATWPTTQLTADPLPADNVMPADLDWDDLAFNIYLLGHDACANHKLTIVQMAKNAFQIDWTGQIALTYKGEDEFKYHFSATISQAKFDGFDFDQRFSHTEARARFAKYLANIDDFEFVDLNPKSNKREYKFALK